MDEFDEATPLRGTYCSRLTSEEYEEQGVRWALIITTILVSRYIRISVQFHRASPGGAAGSARQSARALQDSAEEETQGA